MAAGMGGFLLYSQSGLKFTSAFVSKLSGGQIHIGASSGKILGDWRLEMLTIHHDNFDIDIDELSCSWQPKKLFEKVLQAADVSLAGVEITLKNSTSGNVENSVESFFLPDLTLPVAFLVGNFRVDRLSIKRLGGDDLLGVDSFSAGLSGAANRLEVNDVHFTVSAADGELNGGAEGHLTMSQSWPLELVSDWQLDTSGCAEIDGSARVSGTLNNPRVEIDIFTPAAVQATLGISDLFADVTYEADIRGDSVVLESLCSGLPDTVVDLTLQVDGDFGGLSGSLSAEARVPGSELLSAAIAFHADDQMLRIEDGELGYGGNRAMISGDLSFDDEFNWNAVVSAEFFDLSPLLPLPATYIDARADLSGGFPDGAPIYQADIGDIKISIAEYGLLLEGGLAVNGTMQGLEITSCRFNCGEGTVDLIGSLTWADGLQWEADVRLDSFDPSEIGALPAGNISGNLSSSGIYKDSELLVETNIDSLGGELSGYELSGGGALLYRDQVLTISNLDIKNGQNLISAAGTVDDRFALDFKIDAAEIERIFPPARGDIEITGSLQGPRSDATAHIEVAGSQLSYRNYRVENIAASIDSRLADQALRGDVRLDGVTVADFGADSVELSVDGRLDEHRFSTIVEHDRGRVSADGSGGFKESGWLSRVSGIVVDDQQFGRWQQDGSVNLEVSAAHGAAEGLCLGSGENLICTGAAWQESGAWSLAVDELIFSMESLNRWGLIDIPVRGIAKASMKASGTGAIIESAAGSASADELRLVVGPNEYYEDFVWSGTSIEIGIEDTNLDGRFSTSFIDGSRLSGTLDVSGAGNYDNWSKELPLKGELDADIMDLGFLATLTSEFLLPAGRLSGKLLIGGSVGAPGVSGTISLAEGELRIPMLGTHLKDITGNIEAGFDSFSLELDSRSGDGTLHSIGEFDFGGDQWSGHLSFSGQNCRLLDRRAITLIADPDLDLALGGSGGRLSGKVFARQGLIEVEKIDRSATESSDVVFVDDREQAPPWPFHYSIEVVLGDEVEVTGLGLNGKLGGQLMVASNPDGTTAGRGFLDIVDGSFAVYGSPLQINRGRLTFDGGPVDNPRLDIKASKMIEETRFGYDGVEAGVNITGSADDFEMDLYSIPSMEDSDILAYIILDKPISGEGGSGSEGVLSSAVQAIGLGKGADLISDVSSMLPVDDIRVEGSIDSQETAVVVGKNLSKDLSVSYDYNLFKNAGSFRVRYDFGKGFSVESRNSIESNAVELLYSLER